MEQILGFPADQVIGITAGIFTSASMLPQVIKIIKEKRAEQVSLVMICVLITGVSLWIWYGVRKQDFPIIITNAFSLLINMILIFLRIKYRDK
jgi:MtN3 and saliva related transmembrane protein